LAGTPREVEAGVKPLEEYRVKPPAVRVMGSGFRPPRAAAAVMEDIWVGSLRSE
jgi:hypothetical protein